MVDKNIFEIIELLRKENPHLRVALEHSNPLELLIATILSAQCTDKRVNEVTKKLCEILVNDFEGKVRF